MYVFLTGSATFDATILPRETICGADFHVCFSVVAQDGVVSREEFKQGMHKTDPLLAEWEIDTLFDEIDKVLHIIPTHSIHFSPDSRIYMRA
jgi:hypothetical protein